MSQGGLASPPRPRAIRPGSVHNVHDAIGRLSCSKPLTQVKLFPLNRRGSLATKRHEGRACSASEPSEPVVLARFQRLFDVADVELWRSGRRRREVFRVLDARNPLLGLLERSRRNGVVPALPTVSHPNVDVEATSRRLGTPYSHNAVDRHLRLVVQP